VLKLTDFHHIEYLQVIIKVVSVIGRDFFPPENFIYWEIN